MTVAKLQRYLEELLSEDRQFDAEVVATFKELAQDWFMVSEAEYVFLEDQVLSHHRDRFVDEATRRDLEDFLARAVKSRPRLLERLIEIPSSLAGFFNIVILAFQRLFTGGTADPGYIEKVRREARKINFRGIVSLAKIDPQTEEVAEIEEALRKAITAIDGFGFLSHPPQGRAQNEHTILIKVGVNWGLFHYPTITSWESVYALTKMCFQEAEKRKASVKVIVGDESGIEITTWIHSTRDNFEHTGILRAAFLAGLERAASLEESEPEKFAGAREMLEQAHAGQVTHESENLKTVVELAGVRVAPFDEKEPIEIQIPGARHFREGILVPKFVADEVTDIINLPKPPGRHVLMGNAGLTGALKNHIGFLRGSQRVPSLHELTDRYPAPAEGQTKESYVENLRAHREAILTDKTGQAARKFALGLTSNWEADSSFAMHFHEKIVELYLAVAKKERFSVTDMRRTISFFGPDFGDTIDIGAVIAAKDPLTLDILAGALLKQAYVEIGDALDALIPGSDSFREYLYGKTWLKRGTPFDLMSHIAANSYGLGPVDFAHLDLTGMEQSGFDAEEVKAITSFLEERH